MFLEDTQDEPLSQTSDNSVFDSETLVIPESQENQYHGEITVEKLEVLKINQLVKSQS